MKLPNKVINYNESVLSKLPLVLSLLEKRNYTIYELYDKIKSNLESIDEFLEVLDCLFALNKIKLNEEKRSITLC